MTVSAVRVIFRQPMLVHRAWVEVASLRTLCFVLPCVVFLGHLALFWGWIVDDAGISFAYAKSLAGGHGLVSQPGVEPVEGYSNPTWVALFAPSFALHLFDPVLTPKILSILLVVLSFWVIFRIVEEHASRDATGFAGGLVLLLLAINTPFVVWTTSGLENPLYVFLLCVFLHLTLRAMRHDQRGRRGAAVLGLVAAAIALTRPDGLLFAPTFPLLLAIAFLLEERTLDEAKSKLLRVAAYVGSFSFVFGSFILFRLAYFGVLKPNTYYAKQGPDGGDLIALVTFRPGSWARLGDVLGSVSTGPMEGVALILILVLTWRAVRSRHIVEITAATFLWVAAGIVLLLPADWMAENRFATPFVVFFSVLIVLSGREILGALNADRFGPFLVPVVVGGFLVASAVQFAPRSIAFSEAPTVPLDSIRERFAERFNGYAQLLELEDGSILLPDLGGTLLYSDLRVYDLAGLTDRTIARTIRADHEEFYDYVFDSAQPTFIHGHEWWAYRADLDGDLRFRRDYVAICEAVDSWAIEETGEVIYTGDYVRRDAVKSPVTLAAMRSQC